MLKLMRLAGVCAAICRLFVSFLAFFPFLAQAVPPPSCLQGARQFYPCELSFDMQANELPSPQAALADDLLNIEFRSPGHTTYLMRHFWTGGRTIKVRFTPTEPGSWAYKVTSGSKRLDDQEGTFTAAETAEAGLVNVANVRHWRTTNKKPHLWLGADVPWLDLNQAAFETWLDARKKDGFSHIRGVVLSGKSSVKPFGPDALPNPAYFDALDDKILAAENRSFAVDLVIADESFVRSGIFDARERLEPLVRYLVGRYGGLNITWQGLEHFEDMQGSRALLRDIGLALKKYDGFRHPLDRRSRQFIAAAGRWLDEFHRGSIAAPGIGSRRTSVHPAAFDSHHQLQPPSRSSPPRIVETRPPMASTLTCPSKPLATKPI